jgi:hypothetical protein
MNPNNRLTKFQLFYFSQRKVRYFLYALPCTFYYKTFKNNLIAAQIRFWVPVSVDYVEKNNETTVQIVRFGHRKSWSEDPYNSCFTESIILTVNFLWLKLNMIIFISRIFFLRSSIFNLGSCYLTFGSGSQGRTTRVMKRAHFVWEYKLFIIYI